MGNIELIQPNAPLDLRDFVTRQENGYIETEKVSPTGPAYILSQKGYGPQIIRLEKDDIYNGKVRLTGYEFNKKDGTVTVHFTENSPEKKVHSNAKIVCVFPENKYTDKTKVHHDAPIRSMSFIVDHNGQHQEVEILINKETNTYILTVNEKSDVIDMNHPNPFKHSVTSFDMSHPWHPKRANTDNYFQFLKEKLASIGRFNLRSSELVQIFSDLQTLTQRAEATARTAAVPSTTTEVRGKLTQSITTLAKIPGEPAFIRNNEDESGGEAPVVDTPGNYDPSNGAVVPFPGDDEAPDEEDTSDAHTDPGSITAAADEAKDNPTTDEIEPANPVEPDAEGETFLSSTGDAEPTPIAPESISLLEAPTLSPAPAPAAVEESETAVAEKPTDDNSESFDAGRPMPEEMDPMEAVTTVTVAMAQFRNALAASNISDDEMLQLNNVLKGMTKAISTLSDLMGIGENLKKAVQEADKLRTEKSAAEEERDAEKAEHRNTQSDLDAAREELQTATKRAEEAESALVDVKATLATETEAKEAALRAVEIRRGTISSRDGQIGRLQTQIEQLEVEAREAAKALETARTNLTNAEENRDRFRVGLQDTIRQKTELKAAHRQEIDEKNAELRTANIARQQAEAEHDAAKNANRTLRLGNASLNMQKEAKASDLKKELARTAQLQDDLRNANDLNQRWRTSWHEVNDQAKAMMTENNRLRAELDRLRESQPKKSWLRRKK